MEVIGRNPKKSSWQIWQAEYGDGRVAFITGDYLGMQGNYNDKYRQHIAAGANITLINIPVFWARLKPDYCSRASRSSFFFNDEDNNFALEANDTSAMEIFKAVADGKLQVENGCFTGYFTLIKKSSVVLLGVYDGPALNDDMKFGAGEVESEDDALSEKDIGDALKF